METLLREILDYCQEKYSLPYCKLLCRYNVGGSQLRHGVSGKFSMTINRYWFRVDELAIASLLHEISHIVQYVRQGYFSHDRQFRAIEIELLADFGLRPIDYKKAYYYRLETINGKHFWIR